MATCSQYVLTGLVLKEADVKFPAANGGETGFIYGNQQFSKDQCYLLVVPNGLVPQWKEEIERFAGPSLEVYILKGKPANVNDWFDSNGSTSSHFHQTNASMHRRAVILSRSVGDSASCLNTV